jgi:hypothetical protein
MSVRHGGLVARAVKYSGQNYGVLADGSKVLAEGHAVPIDLGERSAVDADGVPAEGPAPDAFAPAVEAVDAVLIPEKQLAKGSMWLDADERLSSVQQEAWQRYPIVVPDPFIRSKARLPLLHVVPARCARLTRASTERRPGR